jgi:mycothiol synthase
MARSCRSTIWRDATLRRVESFRVLREFAPRDVEHVRALIDDVEAATGIVPLGDDAWTGMHAAQHRDLGILDTTDRAYAHLAHHHASEWSIELAVMPDTPDRRNELLARALELVAEEGGGHVTFWVHDAHDGAEDDARARAAGLTPERELLQMRVPLPLTDPPPWPDDVNLRTFRPGEDETAWVEVNNRAFAGHPEQGAWTVDMLRAREQEPWFDPDGFLLAFDDDGLAGSCWTKVHPPNPPREPDTLGEIYVIGADPSRHGRGLGRALTGAGLASLAARGIRVGMLFVDAANEAAVGLYRSLGFTTVRTDRAYGIDVA